MAPEFNDDDAERDFVICDEWSTEDAEGDKFDEDEDTDDEGEGTDDENEDMDDEGERTDDETEDTDGEDEDTDEINGLEVDIWDGREFTLLFVAVVVVDEMLDRLLGLKDVEGVDVEASGRISTTVRVKEEKSLGSLAMAQATMSFTKLY